jgi:catechol 2,3-dioxygenase-like lactoylglutathione lyase family enzyme
MLTYIDHVTLAVRDMEQAVDAFRQKLSMIVGKRQVDTEAGVTNAIIPLMQGYLQLLSPIPARASTPSELHTQLSSFLEAQEGIFRFAIRSSNIAGDVASLHVRGSTLDEPKLQTDGSEDKSLGWWTSFPATEPAEVAEPFLIQPEQAMEDAVRQAALAHPFAIRSIQEVAVVVPKVDQALLVYERDFGVRQTRELAGCAQISLRGSKIMLIPSSATPLGTPLGIYSISLGTTDINGAKAQLRLRDVAFQDDPFNWGIASQIDPTQTCGSRIVLVQM